jgi:Type IV secretion system pilin
MIIINKIVLLTLLSITFFLFFLIPHYSVYADSGVALSTCTLDANGNPTACNSEAPTLGQFFDNVVPYMISVVYVFVELTFFIMILMHGFHFLASRGDPKEMAAARSGIMNSVIGFFIVMIAYIIIIIIANITGLAAAGSPYSFTNSSGQIYIHLPI